LQNGGNRVLLQGVWKNVEEKELVLEKGNVEEKIEEEEKKTARLY